MPVHCHRSFLVDGHLVARFKRTELLVVEFEPDRPAGDFREEDVYVAADVGLQGPLVKFGAGTGEGSVAVAVDGVRKDEVGYVTSRNGMIMITVADDRVVFSQIPAQ